MIVSLDVDDTNCPEGGTKFISSSGTISYACNGSSGGGGSGTFGTGYVNVGACDSSVKISLESSFTNGEFKMSAINLQKLSGECDQQELTVILKIRSSFPSPSDGLIRNYNPGDVVRCTKILDLIPTSGIDANTIRLSETECEGVKTPSGSFRFDDVYAYDISTSARGLLIQIAAS